MKIYILTNNFFLFTGIEYSLNDKLKCESIMLTAYHLEELIIFDAINSDDVFILTDCCDNDFHMIAQISAKKSAVFVLSNNEWWNRCNIFGFTVINSKSFIGVLLIHISLRHRSLGMIRQIPKLTSIERIVLSMTSSGNAIFKISAVLNTSTKTAYTHQRRVLDKIGLKKKYDIAKLPHNFITYMLQRSADI